MLAALGIIAALWLMPAQPAPPPFVPTLDLTVRPVRSTNGLAASTLLGTQSGVDILEFSEAELQQGVMLPKDKHLILHCGTGTLLRPGYERDELRAVRFWLYEYSGRESTNHLAGKRGLKLLDGRFLLSVSERIAGLGRYDALPVLSPYTCLPNHIYYAMFERSLYISSNSGLSLRPPSSQCGNGSIETGEDCDDGNVQLGDGCASNCLVEACHDSDDADLQTRGWARDAVNVGSDWCQRAGEGLNEGIDSCFGTGCYVVEMGCGIERLYSPYPNPQDHVFSPAVGCFQGCTQGQCIFPDLCGNSRLDAAIGETCDDGNRQDKDGCSSSCFIERHYACSGTPSRCNFILPFLPHVEGAFSSQASSNASMSDSLSSAHDFYSECSCNGLPIPCGFPCTSSSSSSS